MTNFISTIPTAPLLLARSYSRWTDRGRETYPDVVDRCMKGLIKLGRLTQPEGDLLRSQMEAGTMFPSGRYLWCGGTGWAEKPENYYGNYNCSATEIDSIETFGYMMNLAMCGTGTGANLEPRNIDQLPEVRNQLEIRIIGEIGAVFPRNENTKIYESTIGGEILIEVGDSRKGWVDSYVHLIELSMSVDRVSEIHVDIDISNIRPVGTKLKGFGGTANPVKLPELYGKIADILNGAIGRKLTALECCLLIDAAALVVVAGSIRRSAGIKQFAETEPDHKSNLYVETDGKWSIDPKRASLIMSNHTRVFHQKPTLEQCVESVRSQYYSGEGAIQWAGEAIARSNADILKGSDKHDFLAEYDVSIDDGRDYLEAQMECEDSYELDHRMNRYALNPCGEIIFTDGLCNLSDVHLNQLNPLNLESQDKAFEAAAISVCALLHHEFVDERYQKSRELDPIVGVSFTGLFDFFVNMFGADWLKWWQAGRPETYSSNKSTLDFAVFEIAVDLGLDLESFEDGYFDYAVFFTAIEQKYLQRWQKVVTDTVADYCARHNLKAPNRCTTVQPSGSKALLTGASPGWHPPKAQRYIRRITFAKNDPIALAAIDYGYSVIPSQSDKDEYGNLLDNPDDSRCTEWLIEIPCQVAWADIPGVQDIDISQFSALTQMDFYGQVQQHYTQHNTSATIELREHEIDGLGQRIYDAIQDDEGYVSVALLSRFDDHQAFPRLPFEPIDKATYNDMVAAVRMRRISSDFDELLSRYDFGTGSDGSTSGGCDSDKCLMSGNH